MSNKYNTTYIGDISNINANSYSSSENWEYVNYLDTGNITKNKIDEIQYIDLSVEKLPSRAKRKVIKNSIIYSTVRPNQQHFGFIDKQPENFLVSTGFAVIDVKPDTANPKFVYYYLTQDKITDGLHALAEQSVSAYPSIKPSDVGNVKIFLPDLPTQEKIAGLLSSLDDKIELNNKINQNLEQQAQAIFDKYIKIPCNYLKTGTIGDYCNVKSGFAFKSSWWKDSGVKVIKIKTIDNESINFSECSFVDKEKISIAEDFIVKGGDLLIAMTGATIGKFAIVPKIDEVLLVNQRVGKFFLGIHPIKKLPFLYCTLKQQDIINDIINKGQGSAQPNISSTDILNTSCYILENTELEKFNLTCEPIFEKIITNKYENEKLKQLRDTLLPKLMSGEINVDKLK